MITQVISWNFCRIMLMQVLNVDINKLKWNSLRLNFRYIEMCSSFYFTNKNSHLCMHGYIWIIYGLYELWSPMFMRQVSLFPFLGSNKNERRLARKWKRERKLNKLEKWFGILWGCCIKTRQHIYIYVYIILKDKFAIKIKYVFHFSLPFIPLLKTNYVK